MPNPIEEKLYDVWDKLHHNQSSNDITANIELINYQLGFLRQAFKEIYTQGKQDAVKEILEMTDKHTFTQDVVTVHRINDYAKTLTTSKE